jgi:hypothetical protein
MTIGLIRSTVTGHVLKIGVLMRRMRLMAMLALIGLVSVPTAWAAPIIYANNAGTPHIDVIDAATMTVMNEFLLNGGSGNGRGVVVVGNTLYFTLANSGNVFTHNLTTNAEAVAFNVAGSSGLSTIAFDGANFWIGDYSGTKNAYNYTPSGTLLSTVSLSLCSSFCDGLEFFLQAGQGRLISNRGDTLSPGIYDVYSTTGAVLQPAFLTVAQNGRGIAFDGTNFRVAGSNTISTFNGTTGALISTQTVTGSTLGLNFEDLSVDYQLVLPPTDTTVPEPTTLVLLGSGLIGAASRRFRRRS